MSTHEAVSIGFPEPTLTLNLVIDALPGFEIARIPRNAKRKFSWCQAYFDSPERYPQPDIDDEHILYFAEETNGLSALNSHPNSFVAVVTDRGSAFEEKLDALLPPAGNLASRVLVLVQPEMPISLACVVSLVQLRVQKVQNWCLALQAIAEKTDSVQSLLDLGEDMFGNFMNVSDGSYALLGYTKNIGPSGSLNTALIKKGFHDADTIGRYRKAGIFGLWSNQRGVKVFEPTEEIPCPFMTYVMKHQGQYCGHVVMVCNHEGVTPWQVDLFEVFALACNGVVRRALSGNSQINPPFYSFLAKLITDSRCSQEFVANQSQVTGIPAEGCFQLAAVEVEGPDLKAQLSFIMASLARVVPHGYVFLHERRVFALTWEKAYSVEGERHLRKGLSRFCASNDCLAYLSDHFSRIRDIRLAYFETQAVCKYRRAIDVWKRPYDDIAVRRLFTVDDAFMLICHNSESTSDLRDFCVNHSALERLSAQTDESDVSDLRFLHSYLLNERRATPTSAQLGLHRNTIVYRANRLKEQYGIDLDQSSVRERLAFCLMIKIATNSALAEELSRI